jgi:hypothetical protein
MAAIIGGLWLLVFTVNSQSEPESTARVRIDAYGYIRWTRATIDPSGGTKTYRFRLNAANGGRTTGGFAIAEPGWLTGKVYRMDVDPATVKKPKPGKSPATPVSPRAKVYASCMHEGNKYRLEFEVVGDEYHQPSKPGARGRSVPGVIKVRLIGPLSASGSSKAPVQEAITASGTRVRSLVYWPDSRRPDTNLGGPVSAPAGP